MIELRNVTKRYGKKQNVFTALKDISLTIPDGVSVAILGKSGSGKSTLMHAISGLDTPQEGRVVIDGQDIFRLKRRQIDAFRAKKIGFIFQSFFVEGGETAAENVSLPLEIAKVPRAERAAKIAAALRAVDLHDKRKNKARDLSGGQKQRLAIARAIVNNPPIIFADEPTGNLDSETGALVEKLLFDHQRQHHATLIMVTHDADLAAKCQYQIIIKDGQIASTTLPAKKDRHGH
ncbi:MAG: ABC transporter ATP-binding protein [Candidatus Saccharibacteria bacterium]|nr:ABC transporter ATP-binding protein [Candidatus Saccharibacteria bacterium]